MTNNNEVKNNIPRMRTIDGAMAEIRQADPNSNLTRRALQRMVYSGEIPSVKIGNKNLLNLDFLIDFLSGGMYSQTATCVS